jgi:dsDNA-specific endonuclease/ATPase MutS2
MEWRLRRYRDILNPSVGEGDFTKSKLVVIDELGTGTSQNEGYAVGRTVMEGLVNATDRTTGFVVTTHNDDVRRGEGGMGDTNIIY